jgi:hypothetical protein
MSRYNFVLHKGWRLKRPKKCNGLKMSIKCNVDNVTCFNEFHAISFQRREPNTMFVIGHEPKKIFSQSFTIV